MSQRLSLDYLNHGRPQTPFHKPPRLIELDDDSSSDDGLHQVTQDIKQIFEAMNAPVPLDFVSSPIVLSVL